MSSKVQQHPDRQVRVEVVRLYVCVCVCVWFLKHLVMCFSLERLSEVLC